MIKSKEIKVFTLSALCCAVLTACGGGGEDSVFIDGNVGKVGGKNELPVNDDSAPSVQKFLGSNAVGIGQQTDLIVASVKHGNNPRGAVLFNQPGAVSEVCLYGDDCVNQALERAVKSAEKEVERLKPEKDGAEGSSGGSSSATASPELKAAQEKLDSLKELTEALEGKVVIRNVNNNILVPKGAATIDFDTLPHITDPQYTSYLVQRDAGVKKKDYVRQADGSLSVDGGTIDRAFNGVVLFQDPFGGSYIDAYARDPAASGWSYQTFAVFSDKDYTENRDLNVGYQSFGQKTKNLGLPAQGKATYRGISHAYYNKNQVTSHNKIDVDFAGRSVRYRTEGVPLLHTFEKGKHIVQERPDYAVSADATFARNNNSFEGPAKTDAGLSGTLQGQFYGDSVQEVGGVYGLKDDNGTVHYIGGFGAKR